jgi:hypothetical protein
MWQLVMRDDGEDTIVAVAGGQHPLPVATACIREGRQVSFSLRNTQPGQIGKPYAVSFRNAGMGGKLWALKGSPTSGNYQGDEAWQFTVVAPKFSVGNDGFMAMNDDWDNGSTTQDCTVAASCTNEDDLVSASFSVEPMNLTTGVVSLSVISNVSNEQYIAIWTNKFKAGTKFPASTNWPVASMPRTLWLEGIQPSQVASDICVRVTYSNSISPIVWTNETRLTVVDVDIVTNQTDRYYGFTGYESFDF